MVIAVSLPFAHTESIRHDINWMSVCLYVSYICMCLYIGICKHTCMYVYTFVCRHTKYVTKSMFKCANRKIVKVFICSYIHSYKHTKCVYIYIYIIIHTYIQTRLSRLEKRRKQKQCAYCMSKSNEIESAEEISIQVM